MPLPKPSKSKTVSRRIKKPKPLLFPASQAEQLIPDKPNKPPLRERRVRVICTDPDATDSSSDEEGERASFSPKYTHKRLIREICLPASLPVSFNNKSQPEETSMATVASSNPWLASEKRKGFKIERKEVGLQSLYERTDEPIVGLQSDCPPAGVQRTDEPIVGPHSDCCLPACPPADNSSGSSGTEEFALFLDEFFGANEKGSIRAWDEELALLDESIFDFPLNLELDFESATWINSVQPSPSP